MTKTLTEQWKDGKLGRGLYYVRSTSGRECVCIHSGSQSFMFSSNDKYACQVKEVLAPVPSYDEWQSYDKCADMLIDVNKKWHKTIVENKKLKKQLAIATKALKKMAKDNFQCAEQALEEIELREVK